MSDKTQIFEVELIEKSIGTVELVEKELIAVELSKIDLIPRKTYINELEDITVTNPLNGDVLTYDNGYWVNIPLSSAQLELINNETPSNIDPLPSKTFQTVNNFVGGSLEVFLNGIKEKQIMVIDSNTFEFKIDVIISDDIEVSYVKV